MLFLALNIVLLSGFGLMLKHAKNNQQRLNPIGFVSSLTAFFFSVWALSQEQDFEFENGNTLETRYPAIRGKAGGAPGNGLPPTSQYNARHRARIIASNVAVSR